MLRLFKPKHRSILGIDISSSAVKVLAISGSKDQLCVDGYGREWLPPNALDGDLIKDAEAVADCIKTLLLKSQLTSKKVALAVPDSAVISKIVTINKGFNEQELEEFIVIEAEKYLPYPIDEINLDFEILSPSAKNSALLDVLIVASRADNVNQRVDVAMRAGLTATIVDVKSYAVERAAQLFTAELFANGRDNIVAIIDISAQSCHLFVLHGMKLIFSRDETLGGTQPIDAMIERYKMEPEEAIESNDGSSEILGAFKERLLLQIKRTLQFFYSTSPHAFVDHILLAGGSAREEGLDTLIQEKLGVATTVANPFSRMLVNKTVDLELMNNDAPALIVACGLALRNIE